MKVNRVPWGNCSRGGQFQSPIPTFLKPFFNDVLNVCERSSVVVNCLYFHFLLQQTFVRSLLLWFFCSQKWTNKFEEKNFKIGRVKPKIVKKMASPSDLRVFVNENYGLQLSFAIGGVVPTWFFHNFFFV